MKSNEIKITNSYKFGYIYFWYDNKNENNDIINNIINIYLNANEEIRKKYDGYLILGIEKNDYRSIYGTEDIRTIYAGNYIDWILSLDEI